MELKTNNLYANGKIVRFKDGEEVLIRKKFKLLDFENYDYITVTENSELTNMAYRSYVGQVEDPSKLWFLIADVNNVHNPFDLSKLIGEDLAVPNIFELKLLLEK